MMIKEDFLHFLWKYKLFDPDYMFYKKAKVEIIDTGLHNHSSGPDFFNAKIKIGETLWAGNVEIHIKASDWFKHRHEEDPAYDNIILHLVYDPDISVYRKNGEEIPFVRLGFHPGLIERYKTLTEIKEDRECYHFFARSEPVFYQDWISKLGITRLERRVERLAAELEDNQYDWDTTLYHMLAYSFGMKQNSEPFLMLARAVPLKVIYKFRENSLSLNAVFYGQAGFLNETLSDDSYYTRLQKEYTSLKDLLPEALPGSHLWKFMRSRPPAFPTVRIPQFISLVKNTFPTIDTLLSISSIKELRDFFTVHLSNYWVDHFLYGLPGRRSTYMPGKGTLNLWILNTMIPFFFCYGKYRKKEAFLHLALKLMEDLPPENNEILKKWNKFGVRAKNAFDSQALIELKTRYCEKARCTECMIGHKILLNEGKKRQT
jgi:hypothetical protein